MAEIIGKIVRILSDREVVINRGLADGVRYDTEFVIYEEGDPVVDPESPEVLDRIEIVKDRVYVTHLQGRICTASPAPSGVNLGETLARAGRWGEHGISPGSPGARESLQPKLRVAEGEIRPQREVSLEIGVGDKVRNVER
jgi:hypothetical protein